MSHAFTITLPDELYESIRRNAQATHQPPESMLLRSLSVSLPPLDGLPAAVVEDLVRLEGLDDEALRAVAHERVAENESQEIEALLEKNRAETLSDAELDRLDTLRRKADRTMLRKARAGVLLRFRGQPVPTMVELRDGWTPPG
jgi:hypothetical protein